MLCGGRGLNCGKTRLGCCTTTMRRLTCRSSSTDVWQNIRHPLCPKPPYSPDLAPADFFLFPKPKTILKGRCFQTIEEIKENAIRETRAITESVFQEAFQQWKKHWERRIASRGDYFEGDSFVKCCKMSNKVFMAKVRSFFLNMPCTYIHILIYSGLQANHGHRYESIVIHTHSSGFNRNCVCPGRGMYTVAHYVSMFAVPAEVAGHQHTF